MEDGGTEVTATDCGMVSCHWISEINTTEIHTSGGWIV